MDEAWMLRWLWLNHVPSDLSLSRAERRRVRRLAHELRERTRIGPGPMRVLAPFGAVLALAVIAAILLFATDKTPAVVAAAAVVAVVLLITYLRWRAAGRYVRLALRTLGHEVCAECGYLLRGLTVDSPTCPECGELRILMVRRRPKPAGIDRGVAQTYGPTREGGGGGRR